MVSLKYRRRVASWVMALGAAAVASLVFSACSKDGEASQNAKGIANQLPAAKDDLPLVAGEKQTAVFAGGCFWCTEAVFERVSGVHDVVSGYAGGRADDAKYSAVAAGKTDHAEAVQIIYDPGKVTYGTLLRVFFATHDPTQLNRQGPDVGKQYRSAVFYRNDDEKRVAKAYIEQLGQLGKYKKPIVTTLEPLDAFYNAEGYHQDYARQNPDDMYIQLNARPKVEKLKKQFPELLEDKAK